MLSNETMGVLALAILWVNTLLVAGAAWLELRDLAARRAGMKPLAIGATGLGLFEACVTRGDGPGGAIAVQRTEQVGRNANEGGSGRGILFADRSYASEIPGGEVETTDGRRVVVRAETDRAEVWPSPEAVRESASCPGPERFDEAYELARKARGFTRTVTVSLRPGDRVWIAGELAHDPEQGLVVRPGPRGLLVSAIDPRALCARRIALVVVAILGLLGVAAGFTAIALVPPAFGTVSKIGAGLCLAYFLLVQPAGTALRDAVRPPSRAILRGAWRSESAGPLGTSARPRAEAAG